MTSNTQAFSPETQEIFVLLKELYGYDFSGYAQASLERRIARFVVKENLDSPSDIPEKLIRDPLFHVKLVQSITVNYTEMFRDPGFFRALRHQVLPFLSTYPNIRIWLAGCSTGEEVYSMAILLHEVELLERTRIYATDVNESVLAVARAGNYSAAQIKNHTANYIQSGGLADFSKYYSSNNGKVRFHEFLRRNVVFDSHNLATDQSINEFHLILCRNVFIYFTQALQAKVTRLFAESLCNLGYLGIGQKEMLNRSETRLCFSLINKDEKIYRKVTPYPQSVRNPDNLTQ